MIREGILPVSKSQRRRESQLLLPVHSEPCEDYGRIESEVKVKGGGKY